MAMKLYCKTEGSSWEHVAEVLAPASVAEIMYLGTLRDLILNRLPLVCPSERAYRAKLLDSVRILKIDDPPEHRAVAFGFLRMAKRRRPLLKPLP